MSTFWGMHVYTQVSKISAPVPTAHKLSRSASKPVAAETTLTPCRTRYSEDDVLLVDTVTHLFRMRGDIMAVGCAGNMANGSAAGSSLHGFQVKLLYHKPFFSDV